VLGAIDPPQQDEVTTGDDEMVGEETNGAGLLITDCGMACEVPEPKLCVGMI